MSKERRQAAQAETPANPPVAQPWWEYRFSLFTLVTVAFFAGSLCYGIGVDRGRQAVGPNTPHEHGQASSSGTPATTPVVSEGIAEQAIKGTTDVAQLIEIGNQEFDADRPRLAVLAYEKALSYQPNNPDVRTDLGVMYRRLGRFDEAIKQFEQARKLSPDHENSRFNLGIVHMYDLGQHALAVAAWEDYLRVAPNGERADQARHGIVEARRHLGEKGKRK